MRKMFAALLVTAMMVFGFSLPANADTGAPIIVTPASGQEFKYNYDGNVIVDMSQAPCFDLGTPAYHVYKLMPDPNSAWGFKRFALPDIYGCGGIRTFNMGYIGAQGTYGLEIDGYLNTSAPTVTSWFTVNDYYPPTVPTVPTPEPTVPVVTPTVMPTPVTPTSTPTAPVVNEPKDYYWQTSRKVAKDIGCKNVRGFKYAPNGNNSYLTTAVCDLNGNRVNVITFKNMNQQMRWHFNAKRAFGPKFYWAEGWGANIVAKNGNKKAAKIGARKVRGEVYHG